MNDVSAQAGVQDLNSITRAIAVADFDGDGYDDFFVSNSSGGTRLWHNNHDGTFTDLARSVGITTTISS